MPRQQVEDLDGLPRLVPTASPTSGFQGTARIAPTTVDVTFVERLGDRARRYFLQLDARTQGERLEKARADVADSNELVDELLDSLPEDEEVRREALRRAEAQGLISRSDDPFFRLALAEAEGRRAAERAIGAARRRMIAGEHLPKPDQLGNLTGGQDVSAILDEELGRYDKSPALRTQIGAAAFNRELAFARPALLRYAGDQRAQVELSHLQGIVTDEISSRVRLAQDVEPDELGAVLGEIEGLANDLRDAGDPEFRMTATEAVLRGADLIAEDDPERALELVNTALAGVRIAGQSLDENPRTAEMLANARHRFRRAADEDATLAIRERERREKEHLRVAEDFLSKLIREQVGGGASASETRRRARTAYENFLTQGSKAVELAPDAELLRREGLRLIDALTAETAATNPFVAEEMVTRIALATTPGELTGIEDEIRHLAGSELTGKALDSLLRTAEDRRQVLGLGGLSSNPTYGRAVSALSSVDVPAGAPLATRIQLGGQLRAIDAEFNAAADRLARAGQVDEAELDRLGREYAERKRQLVQQEEVRIDAQRAQMFEDIRGGATPDQVRDRYLGGLSTDEIQDGVARAEQRQTFVRDLVNDELVRSPLSRLADLVAEEVGGRFVDSETLILELEAEYQAHLAKTLQGQDLDFTAARGALLTEGRAWVQERLQRAGAMQDAGATSLRDTFGPGSGESTEEAQGRVQAANADLDVAAALAAGGDPRTTRTHPLLQRLVPAPAAEHFGGWQQSAYRRGLLANVFDLPRTRPAAARASLEYEAVRSARQLGADAGRAYVAAVAPVGIPVDAVLAGEATVKAGRRLIENVPGPGERRSMVARRAWGRLAEPLTVRFATADVPPYSTPLFGKPGAVERFVNGRPDDFDALMALWGIEDAEEQKAWVRVQTELARRQERAEARSAPGYVVHGAPTVEL